MAATQHVSAAHKNGEALFQAFVDCWNADDMDGLAALFTADCDFVNVVGFWWRKPSQIRKAHAYAFKTMFSGSTLVIDQLKERKLSETVRLAHAVMTLTGQRTPDGNPAEPRENIITLIATRQAEGGFLITGFHNTDRIGGVDTYIRQSGDIAPISYQDTKPKR